MRKPEEICESCVYCAVIALLAAGIVLSLGIRSGAL